ncbi:hypothetical protein CEUSTIGMA_g1611.t1 [Chlamydomonas eustigma]|uniref:Uncharacterized protein n=1 Tax=Chlamydomonas eustigma TaxID=1157962 RepID=A0A250WU56_9CHLO|nr:hypothetical protein CEUSTIGMA_g1611.t1 [Chlamydomonas eustigma]|eukprot:GAX74162.1 hypothetical protein CEUSTIGMA_g1611.t1 [Chlamydomonas eustigma]
MPNYPKILLALTQKSLSYNQNFDSGFLGENVFGILQDAHLRGWLNNTSMVIPGCARVYCMPVQLNHVKAVEFSALQACGSNYSNLPAPTTESYAATQLSCSINIESVSKFVARPDYEALSLTLATDGDSWGTSGTKLATEQTPYGWSQAKWLPLAEPQLLFEFPLNKVNHKDYIMAHNRQQLEFNILREGTFNAVVFWHDLSMCADKAPFCNSCVERGVSDMLDSADLQKSDRENIMLMTSKAGGPILPSCILSNSPYNSKISHTWQQAVFWMPPKSVQAENKISLIGEHDAYGINFKMEESNVLQPASIGSNWLDPLWKIKYEDVKALSEGIFCTAKGDPLEFKSIALSTLKLATRPQDFGVDADFASMLCLRTMHV